MGWGGREGVDFIVCYMAGRGGGGWVMPIIETGWHWKQTDPQGRVHVKGQRARKIGSNGSGQGQWLAALLSTFGLPAPGERLALYYHQSGAADSSD